MNIKFKAMNKTIKNINDEIYNWWYKNKCVFNYKDKKNSSGVILPPTLIHDLSKDAEILFIGLNPGGNSKMYFKNKGTKKRFSANNFIDNLNGERDYLIEHERYMFKENEYPNYFGIFHRIANDIYRGGYTERIKNKKIIKVSNDITKIEHIDLFPCRGTDSKQVMEWLLKINDNQHGIDVFNKVLNYLKKVKVVVFNNVNSSNIIKKTMINPKMTKNLTYKYIIKNRNIDLIFQGTMGYGRLDEFAMERLVKIIQNVFKKQNYF